MEIEFAPDWHHMIKDANCITQEVAEEPEHRAFDYYYRHVESHISIITEYECKCRYVMDDDDKRALEFLETITENERYDARQVSSNNPRMTVDFILSKSPRYQDRIKKISILKEGFDSKGEWMVCKKPLRFKHTIEFNQRQFGEFYNDNIHVYAETPDEHYFEKVLDTRICERNKW